MNNGVPGNLTFSHNITTPKELKRLRCFLFASADDDKTGAANGQLCSCVFSGDN